MLYITNLLSLQKNKKNNKNLKKPKEQSNSQISSLRILNLPLKKLDENKLEEEESEERPLLVHHTDKIAQLSERFGKIVKQKRSDSVTKEQENSSLRCNRSGRILKQSPV